MMKKILRISNVVIILLLILFAIPFFFKDTLKEKLLTQVNKELSATVSFETADISLISSFPKVRLTVGNLSIINTAPFEGDTLLVSEKLMLGFQLSELFNINKEPLAIESLTLQNAIAHLKVNKQGAVNYDIVLDSEENEANKDTLNTTNSFELSLQKYTLDNLTIHYQNLETATNFSLKKIVHQGSGNFKDAVFDLETHTEFDLSLSDEQFRVKDKIAVMLDATLQMDLENQSYRFQKNKLLINQLPLVFDGNVAMLPDGSYIDLTFETPTTSIKHLLGFVPQSDINAFNALQTGGSFAVKGAINGILSEESLSITDLARISFVDSYDPNNFSVDTSVYSLFTLEQIMVRNPTCIPISATIKDAAEIFLNAEFHALPIVDKDDKILGIVTTTDLIKYLVEQY